LPTALKAISNYCFSGSGLTSITLPDTVTSIGTQSFAYSDLEEITLPAKLETIGLEAFYSTKLKSIEIPASVTSMTGNTFGDCEDLVMITTADGGTYKSEDDLLYKTVKTDDGTNNYVITHVLPAVKGEYELPSRYIIGAYALNGNDAVTKIKVTTDQLNSNALFYYYGEVEITGGTEIGSYAFANYKGTTLVIPEGVTKIDDYAFNGCSN
jgi:hypothetical protein